MNRVERILKENINNNNTFFIFPSEIAASFWREKSLDLGKTAVLSRRFTSWDTFKENHFSLNQSGIPVNRIIRNLFAVSLLEQNMADGKIFQYIIPGEYAESSAGFRRMLLSVLPRIPDLIGKMEAEETALPSGLKADFRTIYSRYTEFLESRGLFEPGWMKPDISGLKDTYYIFFPEVIEDYTSFSSELEKSERVVPVYTGKREAGKLHRFSSAVLELKWLFNRITGLLDSGTPAEDIVITLADMKGWRKRLEAEAALRSVPVVIREGRPILEYPGVSFFRDLGSCSSSRYSIQSMKQLLLNGAVPWKDKKTVVDLIKFGVENFCVVNYLKEGREKDLWIERFKTGRSEDLSEFYKRLKRSIESITGSASFIELRNGIQKFTSLFLDTGEWEGTPEIKEFQFALNTLNDAAAAYSKCGELKITSPFKIWLTILEEKIYVPREKKRGISVYPYRVSGGINTPWHFIPGFSERVSSILKDEFPFLRDDQKASMGQETEDFTAAFIDLYSGSGENVQFSMSSESFSGAEIPPAYFISSDSIEDYTEQVSEWNDIFDNEYLLWKGNPDRLDRILPVMKVGMESASVSILSAKQKDYTRQTIDSSVLMEFVVERVYREKDILKVSSTMLDTFYRCPYIFFLKYVLRIEQDDYDRGFTDNFLVGTIIHESFRELFLYIQDESGCFKPEKIKIYKKSLERIIESVFQKFKREGYSLFEPVWMETKGFIRKHLEKFLDVEAEEYPGFKLESAEKEVSVPFLDKGYLLNGRIDRISRKDDFRVLVDYKKGYTIPLSRLNPPGEIPDSFQLYFYVFLAESEGTAVNSAAYYSFTKDKYVKLFDENSGGKGISREELDDRMAEMQNHIGEMKEKIDSGKFIAEICESCDFRSICRIKFTVR